VGEGRQRGREAKDGESARHTQRTLHMEEGNQIQIRMDRSLSIVISNADPTQPNAVQCSPFASLYGYPGGK
jgi:hypothetical protein